jgi:Uma2 family endonuclease
MAQATRPLRRVEYDRLVELGFFADERLELLEGILVTMSPQGSRHATAIQRLNMTLAPALVGRADVRVQSPFAATDNSEPEPDVAVVPSADYLNAHPSRAFLIIEVAESSVARDRAKAPLYAVAGVSECWIVNLDDDIVEVHREPRNGVFATVRKHGLGEELRLVAFPEIAVRTDTAIPPRR